MIDAVSQVTAYGDHRSLEQDARPIFDKVTEAIDNATTYFLHDRCCKPFKTIARKIEDGSLIRCVVFQFPAAPEIFFDGNETNALDSSNPEHPHAGYRAWMVGCGEMCSSF